MTAIFITATGTDIGKTFVTAGLIRHFRSVGRKIDALKPVVSGFDPALSEASDPGMLLAALGKPVTPAEIERISPFRFAAPLSPDMAARKENRALDFSSVVDFCRRVEPDGILLIEGVGGVMVPLNQHDTVLDWMTALGFPLILVAGSYLGSISHTLTCLEVIWQRDLSIKALIVNETLNSTVTVEDTIATLTPFVGEIPVLGLPRLLPETAAHQAFAKLAALL